MTEKLATYNGLTMQATEQISAQALAVAEQSKAIIQARYVMAMQRPRSMDAARVKLLDACRRSRFAETALYKKPVGSTFIVGPSARFAEEAIRALGNLFIETILIADSEAATHYRVSITDLENGHTESRDVIVQKIVERSKVYPGQTVLSTRDNTAGKKTYLVKATEDELLNKVNAQISKTRRNLALLFLPSDIKEEALEIIEATRSAETKSDPTAAKKRVVDAFHGLGVSPDKIEKLVGCKLEDIGPPEIGELRTIYQAVSDGEARIADFLDDDPPAEAEASGERKTRVGSVRDKLLNKGNKNGTSEAPEAGQGELPVEPAPYILRPRNR